MPEYNGIYTIQNNEINGKPWFKNNSGCILYFYNANSGGAPSWSLDDRSQDGTNDWFRGGWIEPPNSGGPPLGTRRWEGAGTIKMESVSIQDESGEPIFNSDQKYVFAREEGDGIGTTNVLEQWEGISHQSLVRRRTNKSLESPTVMSCGLVESGKGVAMGLVLTTGTGLTAGLGLTLTGILASRTTTEG